MEPSALSQVPLRKDVEARQIRAHLSMRPGPAADLKGLSDPAALRKEDL